MQTIRWIKGDSYAQPRVIFYLWKLSGLPSRRAFLIVRFGKETRPLFSERNQGSAGIPKRWHYMFGKRLSWYWYGSR